MLMSPKIPGAGAGPAKVLPWPMLSPLGPMPRPDVENPGAAPTFGDKLGRAISALFARPNGSVAWMENVGAVKPGTPKLPRMLPSTPTRPFDPPKPWLPVNATGVLSPKVKLFGSPDSATPLAALTPALVAMLASMPARGEPNAWPTAGPTTLPSPGTPDRATANPMFARSAL
jgi:hypothetical protein